MSTYRGFEFKTYKMTGSGTKGAVNGYVKIPQGHPWYAKDYDDIKVECHGGLTFGANDPEHLGKGFWIGFDTLHYGDGPEVQNEEYVSKECKSIIDQALKALDGTVLEASTNKFIGRVFDSLTEELDRTRRALELAKDDLQYLGSRESLKNIEKILKGER